MNARPLLILAIVSSFALACGEPTEDPAPGATGESALAQGAQRKTNCTLDVHSATFTASGDVVEQSDKTFSASGNVTPGPDGIGLGAATKIVAPAELAQVIRGNGPLATELKTGSVSFAGIFKAKNADGKPTLDAEIRVRSGSGVRSSLAAAIDVDVSRTQLGYESDSEQHRLELVCTVQ